MVRTARKPKEQEPLEKALWKSSSKLRRNMDAAEHKHIVPGLILVKYVSDAFVDFHARLAAEGGKAEGANPEDADEYRAERIFFFPANKWWSWLQERTRLSDVDKDVDAAIVQGGQRNVSSTRIGNLQVVMPPQDVLLSWNRVPDRTHDRQRLNSVENRCQSNLRNTLLPKLMSGELPVGEMTRLSRSAI